MTLLSGETDVIVRLLYHFTVSWRDLAWSPRALANLQFRSKKSDLTTPRHLQCIEK